VKLDATTTVVRGERIIPACRNIPESYNVLVDLFLELKVTVDLEGITILSLETGSQHGNHNINRTYRSRKISKVLLINGNFVLEEITIFLSGSASQVW
jgi:hypothetical protein